MTIQNIQYSSDFCNATQAGEIKVKAQRFDRGIGDTSLYKNYLFQLTHFWSYQGKTKLTSAEMKYLRRILTHAHRFERGYFTLSKKYTVGKSDSPFTKDLINPHNLSRTKNSLVKKGYIKIIARSRKEGGDASDLILFLDKAGEVMAFDEGTAFERFAAAKYRNMRSERGNRKRGRPPGSLSVKLNRGGGVKMTYVVDKHKFIKRALDTPKRARSAAQKTRPMTCSFQKSELADEARNLTGNLTYQTQGETKSIQNSSFLSAITGLKSPIEPPRDKVDVDAAMSDCAAFKEPNRRDKFTTFDQICKTEPLLSRMREQDRLQLEAAIRAQNRSISMVEANIEIVLKRLAAKPVNSPGGYTLAAIRNDWAHYDWESSRIARGEQIF